MAWAVLAAAVLVTATVALVGAHRDQGADLDFWGIVLVAAAALVTVGLRRAPVWALAGAMLAVSAYLLAGYPPGPVLLCMVAAMFEVARRRPPRFSAGVCAIAALTASATVLLRSMPGLREPAVFALGWTAWVVLPWSLGALVHVTAAARERAGRDLAARAATAERLRLAGEVHDAAGHGFALIAMHAGIALLVLDERPDQARASLEAIKTTSGASLADLRRMLDAFHPQDGEAGPTGLGVLVDEVRAAGLPVELTMTEVTLTDEAWAVAYRVVQESLTNVLRHAGPTVADVRVVPAGGEVLVQVGDRGHGAADGAATGGRGLVGLRGRVEAVGGRFAAGPRTGGGFQVAARLPAGGAR
ncbi:sensor histidine kinase [Streptomyces paludis]|uniref:histidine kinase n=1 Tax=Streptomyces paludis TaxID=2282738 RepID=A0A345I1Y0_9ACTN|nr:sensor histidine kinase [Streptomyces paludis]